MDVLFSRLAALLAWRQLLGAAWALCTLRPQPRVVGQAGSAIIDQFSAFEPQI